MGNHFDIASKYPFDVDPVGMLEIFGLVINGPVTPYKTDLSSRLDADRLFRIDANPPWLAAHVELQSGPEQYLDLKIQRYNICAEYQVAKESKFREHLAVISTILLLHPRANSPNLTGNRLRIDAVGNTYGSFHYNVVRLWEIPAEKLLKGPVASLVFATLTKADESQLSSIVEQIEERLANEPDLATAKELRTCSWLLMGLKFTEDFIKSCPWRMELMHESSTYQQLMNEGRTEGMLNGKRDAILTVGETLVGPAGKSIRRRLNTITNPDRLDALLKQVGSAKDWDDLLGVDHAHE